MPFRPPRGVTGLAYCQSLSSYRGTSLFLTSRTPDAFVRLNHSSSNANGRPPVKLSRKEKQRRNEKQGPAQHVGINANFLGEPGEILVVPDRNSRRRKPRNRGKRARQEPPAGSQNQHSEVPFILDELDKQERFVKDDAVNERIDSFRSCYPPNADLSRGDWEDLRLKIESSFTGGQLSGYIYEYKPEMRLLHNPGGFGEWTPGTSPFLDSISDSHMSVAQRVAIAQSLKGKKLLAERILRDCWHLGIAGEVGQQDIQLPSHWLSLFLNSDNFSFDEIASLHNAKIDITHSLRLVRITGTKDVCASISEIIGDATQRIREEDFEPYPEAKRKFAYTFSPDFLDWVSKSYGVSFILNSLNYPSKIFYLVENKRGADNARRTLNLATYKPPSITPFCTYLSATEPASVYTVDPESKTPHFDRKKSWFRWAMSSTQSTQGAILDTPFFNARQSRLSDVLFNLLRNDAFSTTSGGATPDTHESITAAVGRCLFMRKPSFNEESVTAAQLGELSVPRTFITDIPRTTSFLRGLELQLPEEGTHHRIRLLPTAVNADNFPPLELELAVKEPEGSSGSNGELTLHSAKAILSQNTVDFLLPENELDVRFTRTMHYDLLNGSNNNPASDQGVESLQGTMNKWLRGVISMESENAPLIPLPEFCNISLPQTVLRQNRSTHAKESDSPSKYVTAEYMSQPVNDARGTQVHRYDFHGQRLNYIFYESGPFLPNRTTDLFLDWDLTKSTNDQMPKTPNESPETALEREFGTFYGNACHLAFELDRAWRIS